MRQSADNNFKFDENTRKLSKRVENAVGKGEIARDEQFLLFPQCFQKACFLEASKGVIVWEWVKVYLPWNLEKSCQIVCFCQSACRGGGIKSHSVTALILFLSGAFRQDYDVSKNERSRIEITPVFLSVLTTLKVVQCLKTESLQDFLGFVRIGCFKKKKNK